MDEDGREYCSGVALQTSGNGNENENTQTVAEKRRGERASRIARAFNCIPSIGLTSVTSSFFIRNHR